MFWPLFGSLCEAGRMTRKRRLNLPPRSPSPRQWRGGQGVRTPSPRQWRGGQGVGIFVALLLLTARLAPAQNPSLPQPAQAQSALQQAIQQNPGLADVLRQRLQQSGMSPDQIRARLQASGYPANLLDAYLGGGTPGQPSVNPGAIELAAVQALGLPPLP